MRKIVLAGSVLVVALIFTGCAPAQYRPKPLMLDAKGIATVNSAPYGCRYVGNVEGYEEVANNSFGVVGATYGAVRQGAMNDLKNNATDVVKKLKRAVLFIAKEEILCFGGFACNAKSHPNHTPNTYRIEAQVFECGDK